MARPEKEIYSGASPELVHLIQQMRDRRNAYSLSYSTLASNSHYSVASLSTAASGRRVPSWHIVQAYVTGCDPDNPPTAAEMDQWKTWWNTADAAQNDDLLAPDEAASPAKKPKKKAAAAKGGRNTRQKVEEQETLAELFHEAVKAFNDGHDRQPPQVDPVRAGLLLCTTPQDFYDLLKQLRKKAGLTLDDVVRAAMTYEDFPRSALREISMEKLIPGTEALHAYLMACGVPQERAMPWHQTAIRLKVAQLRKAEKPRHPFIARIRAAYSGPELIATLVPLISAAVMVFTKFR
ncbi:hypothetical protein ACIOHS_45200 [Streptomyces sp. NPDC088253]|uniref:hypothetical protein n=1 Tax=Streptomyces sp. NPDC088253 TaxID=3365846 RepID=UPI00382B5EA8